MLLVYVSFSGSTVSLSLGSHFLKKLRDNVFPLLRLCGEVVKERKLVYVMIVLVVKRSQVIDSLGQMKELIRTNLRTYG